MFFSHFNRVKMSEETPSDLYFEISNGAPSKYTRRHGAEEADLRGMVVPRPFLSSD